MFCACGNHARYVDEDGRLTCAICPLREGKDSIGLRHVPALLAWARRWSERRPMGQSPEYFRQSAIEEQRELKSIIGRKL